VKGRSLGRSPGLRLFLCLLHFLTPPRHVGAVPSFLSFFSVQKHTSMFFALHLNELENYITE
jgi:hypothetical protein